MTRRCPGTASGGLHGASRIHVTGNAGAGKSTAARLLGERLGLPVHHLDRVVWQPGWRKTPPEVREPLERELVGRPAWVIDGVSRTVRDAADVVVFLDTPRGTCLVRAARRTLRHLRRQRAELPPECPEWRIAPYVARLILRFPSRAGRDLREEAAHDPRYVVVTSRAGLAALLDAAGAVT